jgi:hypothetical protein
MKKLYTTFDSTTNNIDADEHSKLEIRLQYLQYLFMWQINN